MFNYICGWLTVVVVVNLVNNYWSYDMLSLWSGLTNLRAKKKRKQFTRRLLFGFDAKLVTKLNSNLLTKNWIHINNFRASFDELLRSFIVLTRLPFANILLTHLTQWRVDIQAIQMYRNSKLLLLSLVKCF